MSMKNKTEITTFNIIVYVVPEMNGMMSKYFSIKTTSYTFSIFSYNDSELVLESFCKRDFGRELLLGEQLEPNHNNRYTNGELS